MNTISAVTGSSYDNPFKYQQFHLRDFKFIRGGRAIVSLDTTSLCRPCVTTKKAMQFNEDFPAFPKADFQSCFFLILS